MGAAGCLPACRRGGGGGSSSWGSYALALQLVLRPRVYVRALGLRLCVGGEGVFRSSLTTLRGLLLQQAMPGYNRLRPTETFARGALLAFQNIARKRILSPAVYLYPEEGHTPDTKRSANPQLCRVQPRRSGDSSTNML